MFGFSGISHPRHQIFQTKVAGHTWEMGGSWVFKRSLLKNAKHWYFQFTKLKVTQHKLLLFAEALAFLQTNLLQLRRLSGTQVLHTCFRHLAQVCLCNTQLHTEPPQTLDGHQLQLVGLGMSVDWSSLGADWCLFVEKRLQRRKGVFDDSTTHEIPRHFCHRTQNNNSLAGNHLSVVGSRDERTSYLGCPD